jgi:hypothetical protein
VSRTGYGLDAKAVILGNMDNIDRPRTKYETKPPAPNVGDPMHYDSFIERVCAEYRSRFGV